MFKKFFREIFDREWLGRFFSPKTSRVEKPSRFVDFPEITAERCDRCGLCEEVCPVDAIDVSGKTPVLERDRCIRCGRCTEICPTSALTSDIRSGG